MYAIFNGSKYGWMDQGSIESLSQTSSVNMIEDRSGNRAVFRGVVFLVALGVQLTIIRKLSRLEAILTAVLLCVVLIAFW